MGKKYIITEQQKNMLESNNLSILKGMIQKLKKNNLWNTILKSYDKDLTKFVSKVSASIPSLKGKERDLLGTVLKIDNDPIPYINKFLGGKKIMEQQDPILVTMDVLLGASYIWLAYLMAAAIFYPNVPLTSEDFKDLKNKIKKNREGKEAAKKYEEWQKWVNSDEYKKQQEEIRIENERRFQEEEERRQQEEVTKRLKMSSLAIKQKEKVDELKLQNAPLKDIIKSEIIQVEFERESFEKFSKEWYQKDEKLKSLNISLQRAIDDEKRAEYLKRVEEKRKQDEEEERLKELERQRIEKLNLPLKKFQGKTVNFYNDRNQQILYGKDTIRKMEFDDSSKFGGRSGIFIYTQDGLEYEIICLSNPDRLADYIVLHKQYTKDYKYNNSFVNAVKQSAPNFCKKPKADFSAVRKPVTKKIA